MNDQVLLAVLGALLSSILSLISTYLAFSSSKKLNQLSKDYDLLKDDMDVLKSLRQDMGNSILPNIPPIEEIRESNGEVLFPVHEKLDPIFRKTANSLLTEIDRFPDKIQNEIRDRLEDIRKTKLLTHTVGKQYDFIIWTTRTLNEEIESLRKRWIAK